MSGKEEQYVKDLEKIIRALADVWPADRENVPVAGAAFEEFIEAFDQNAGQLQKLIDLTWDGIKHLYEKDEYFMSVKAATMQAVNTIREYVLTDGDIQVEDFEKSYLSLEKALQGNSESADEMIEVGEESVDSAGSEQNDDDTDPEDESADGNEASYSLDDLASFIMMLNADSVSKEEQQKLRDILLYLLDNSKQPVIDVLEEGLKEADKADSDEEWLKILSQKTEEAIEADDEQAWEESLEEGSTETESEKAETEADEQETAGVNSAADTFTIPENIDVAMIGEFVTECYELIETAESALLDLEESPDNDELINTIFRAFHTIKGTSAFMGLEPISEFTHSGENLLSMVRDGDLSFDTTCADISLESIDIIKQMLDVVETSAGGDPLPRPEGYDSLIDVLVEISEQGVTPKEAFAKRRDTVLPDVAEQPVQDPVGEETSEAVAPQTQKAEPKASNPQASNGTAKKKPAKAASDNGSRKSETESSVRVSVDRLDRLIDMVGELVIAHSVVAQDQAISKDTELQKKVNHTSKILRELQDTSLSLRMVPLKATFHKMNRLVRDLTRKAGKSVKFSTFGEDTEIDRNMVDIINEPLVHMLRNAIDHGIEGPEAREENGKPAQANIWLRASQEGGKVVIEIEDDGRGIDKDKIFDKAVSKGLIDPDKKLTDKEIYNLIFLPGFSSVDKVTDLSGRGVGMDVVRRSIEQLQGKVDVSSELGKGTTISLELPFTLAITDGMLVRVGGQRFIVPTINIDMTFRAEEKDLYTMLGSSEQVSFRGKSVPLIRLHKLFHIEGATEDLMEGTLLVIKNNDRRYALFVDEVIGQQQLVGKSINMMVKMEHISGGAILGDGRVGLILDTAALMN